MRHMHNSSYNTSHTNPSSHTQNPSTAFSSTHTTNDANHSSNTHHARHIAHPPHSMHNTHPKPPSLMAKLFFVLAFALALGLILWLYEAFLYTMIIAALLCISTYWLRRYCYHLTKSHLLATILSVLMLLAVFILPLYFVIHRGAIGLLNIPWKNYEQWLSLLQYFAKNSLHDMPMLHQIFSFVLPYLSFSSLTSLISRLSSMIGKSSIAFMTDSCFIVLFVAIFFYYGERWYRYCEALLPIKKEQFTLIALDVSGVLRVVFFSTVLNVVLQGLAFGILASFFHLDGVLLGVLYGICSLIPIIGGVLVWLPVSLMLFLQGQITQAIILALYSVICIGFIIDNVIKPFLIRLVNHKLLEKPLAINEFVIFFAIFAGLSTCGFWGIIIGPAITAFFIVMVRIYERDFANSAT